MCNELLSRVNLTLGMHNGGEMGKPDDDPTKDVWTYDTDEADQTPGMSGGA